MKKITIFCLFVCLFFVGLIAEKDSLFFGVKTESWDIPIVYEPAMFLSYSHVLSQKPKCIYDYEMLMNKASGNQSWQSIAVELGHSLFHKRADVFAGIGFAKVGLNLNQPEYVVNSNFITQFGESPDSQTCLGDSVSAKSKYQFFWYAGAKLNILKTKNWKMGVEGRYLSFSNSDFAFPLQHKTNDWGKAEMEFSIKGNSIKLWMAEAKFFGSLKVSKKLEVAAAAGYLFEKKEISGKSRYFYKQNLVNIDYNQDWKLMVKPETSWFTEGSVSALLARNLKATVSGSFGAKRGFAIGISYSFDKKETAAVIVKPVVISKPAPTPTAKPAPVKPTPPKKAANKSVAKSVVKPTAKKTVVAPKEAAKKLTVTKTTKPTPPCISNTYTYLFRLGMRFLGFPFMEFGFQFGTIPNAIPTKTSKK
jgi:hypothetical protein